LAGLKDLNNIPKTTDPNSWCDFIELHCLINENGTVTPNDIYDIITDDEISEDNLEDVLKSIENVDLYELDFLINFGEEIKEDIDDLIGNEVSEVKDKLVTKIEDFFLNLAFRADIFGDHYPFEIDLDNSMISLKMTSSIDQELYNILLISANLKYSLSYMPFLTAQFEFFSLEVIKAMLPENSPVYIYGKNNSNIDTPFVGSELSKLKTLAKKLNISLTSNTTERFISKFSTGDSGLDIVGWYSFNDNVGSSIKLFAQCACGKNWIDKQFEVSNTKWGNYFEFFNNPTPMILIPRSFRNENGEWAQPLKIFNTVVVDRLRLLRIIPDHCKDMVFSKYEHVYSEIRFNTIDNFD